MTASYVSGSSTIPAHGCEDGESPPDPFVPSEPSDPFDDPFDPMATATAIPIATAKISPIARIDPRLSDMLFYSSFDDAIHLAALGFPKGNLAVLGFQNKAHPTARLFKI